MPVILRMKRRYFGEMTVSNKKKTGLGKGLDALISSEGYGVGAGQSKKVQEIPLDDIKLNPYQPRTDIDAEKLEELANSIKQHGIIQPIIVSKLSDNKYQMIAGERRLRASKLAGIKKIPAVIAEYTDEQAAEIALIENLQREDLNPYEEAYAYKKLIDDFGLTQEQLAERIGKSRTAVTNILRLLKLPEEILLMLKEGSLSTGHARAILALKEEKLQKEIGEKVIKKQLSVRQTEKLIKNIMKERDNNKKTTGQSPEIIEIQERLQSALAAKVMIKEKRGKGKIEIEFYTADDLSRILDIILQES